MKIFCGNIKPRFTKKKKKKMEIDYYSKKYEEKLQKLK